MKQIRIRINDLLDQHKESIYWCKGCPICTEIKLLSKKLNRKPEDKFKKILAQGADMRRSEVMFLLESEIPKNVIRKALGITQKDFWELMKNFGLSKRRENNMALNISPEEFVQLHHVDGKSFGEIAEIKGLKKQALSNWKWINKDRINAILSHTQPVTAEVKLSKCNCSKEDKSAEYEQLIKALRNDLKEAHNQCDEKDEKIRQLENVNAACEDIENETASLREEKNQLQWEFDKLKSKEYHTNYAAENQKKRIEDISKTLKLFETENKALRDLLRIWL